MHGILYLIHFDLQTEHNNCYNTSASTKLAKYRNEKNPIFQLKKWY